MGGAILHNVGRDGSHNYHVDCKEAILLGFSLELIRQHLEWFHLQLQLQRTKDIHDRVTSDELARSVAEAEQLLELHQERKVEALYYCIRNFNSYFLIE